MVGDRPTRPLGDNFIVGQNGHLRSLFARTRESAATRNKVGYHGVRPSESVPPDLYPPYYEACGADSLRGRAKPGTVVHRNSPAVYMLAKQPVRASAGTALNRSEWCAVKIRVVRDANPFVWPRVYAIGDVLKSPISVRGANLSGVSKASTCAEHRLKK